MALELDTIERAYDCETQGNVPNNMRTVDKIGKIGHIIHLGHLSDGERGLRWLVRLNDNNSDLTTQLIESDQVRYGHWPEGVQTMVLVEMRKKWVGEHVVKEYTLGLPSEEVLKLASEVVLACKRKYDLLYT